MTGTITLNATFIQNSTTVKNTMLIGRIWLSFNSLINLAGTILIFIEFFDLDFF